MTPATSNSALLPNMATTAFNCRTLLRILLCFLCALVLFFLDTSNRFTVFNRLTNTAVQRPLAAMPSFGRQLNNESPIKPPQQHCDAPPALQLSPGVYCSDLLSANVSLATLRLAQMWRPTQRYSADALLQLMQNDADGCEQLREEFCFPSTARTLTEALRPLAFVLIVHGDVEQIVRLFHTIYWPQNKYCFTYDQKADWRLKRFVHRLARCFPDQVVLPDEHQTIHWGTHTVLKAGVNCLQALDTSANRWSFVQILSGNDVPLKTNLEMVEIFSFINGSNDSELKRGQTKRYTHSVRYYPDKMDPAYVALPKRNRIDLKFISGGFGLKLTTWKAPPPGNLTIYKGSFAVSLNREFVHFLLTNSTAIELLNWLNDTYIPDEQYWATLIYNRNKLAAPGSLPGEVCLNAFGQGDTIPYISRFQLWPHSFLKCKGKFVHGSCAFGVDALPLLAKRPELVAHKFYLDYQPAAYFCLIEMLRNRTLTSSDNVGMSSLNYGYYTSLPASRYAAMGNHSHFDCSYRKDFLQQVRRNLL